jgi:actinin alpha
MAQQDPDHLRLQKIIFTRFVNQQFRNHGSSTKINDVVTDVKDGLVLIELLEIMSQQTCAEKQKLKPSTQRIQQIDNCNKALQFLKSCNVKTQAGAEDIVDGKVNLVMGTIFQIILKYMKLDEDETSTSGDLKEALMLWLTNKVAGYNNVKIENFTKSFHDGLAFCALIHKMRPNLIPFDKLNKDEKVKNLNLAMDTAAKYCNVAKYLEANDIPKLDELSMVVYLSDWYYGVSLLQQQDIGARRIGKLIVMTQLHDKMRAEFKDRANKLVAWIDAKIKVLDDHTFDNTLEGIRKKLAEFYDYKANEKGDKISEFMDIESLYHDLALRLQRNKRPPFVAPVTVENLEAKLKALETSENNRSAAMQKELARQIKLDKMSKRFASDLQKFLGWVAEQETYLKTKEQVDSIPSAQMHINILASFNKEYDNVKVGRLAALQGLAKEIIDMNYIYKDKIAGNRSDAEAKFNALAGLSQAKDKVLQDDLAREKHKEKLRLDFASLATDFDYFSKDEIENTKNCYFGDTLEDVQAHGPGVTQKETQVKARADEKKAAYDAVWAELQQYKVTENKYTNLTINDLVNARAKLDEALKNQRNTYNAELAKQQANDKLCKEFADKAQKFMDNLSKNKAATTSKSGEDLDAALKVVNGFLADKSAGPVLDELDALEKKIRDAEIASNKYTQLTANDARTSQKQFEVSLNKRKTLLEAEIESQKRLGILPEQLKEIEDNFKKLNKSGNNLLERREFRQCLQSLGQDSSPKAVDAALAQYNKGKDGKMSFDEFKDYMIKRLGDTNTKEEILDAFFLINQKDVADMELMKAVVNGTTFKQEYVDYLQKEMTKDAAGYNYKKWTDEVFAR